MWSKSENKRRSSTDTKRRSSDTQDKFYHTSSTEFSFHCTGADNSVSKNTAIHYPNQVVRDFAGNLNYASNRDLIVAFLQEKSLIWSIYTVGEIN